MFEGEIFAFDLQTGTFHQAPSLSGRYANEKVRHDDVLAISYVPILPEPIWGDHTNKTFKAWYPRENRMETIAHHPLPGPIYLRAYDGRFMVFAAGSGPYEIWSFDLAQQSVHWLYNTSAYAPYADYGYPEYPLLSFGTLFAEYWGASDLQHVLVVDLANHTQAAYPDWFDVYGDGLPVPYPYLAAPLGNRTAWGALPGIEVMSLDRQNRTVIEFPDADYTHVPLGLADDWILMDLGGETTIHVALNVQTNRTVTLPASHEFDYSLQTLNAWYSDGILAVLGPDSDGSGSALYWKRLPP